MKTFLKKIIQIPDLEVITGFAIIVVAGLIAFVCIIIDTFNQLIIR